MYVPLYLSWNKPTFYFNHAFHLHRTTGNGFGSLGQVQPIKHDTLTVNNVNHFASPDIQKWVISEVIMKYYLGLTHASSTPWMLDLLSVVTGTLKKQVSE